MREGAANLSRLTWEVKTPADFVSEVDRGSEAAIARVVAERHPEARLIGEELSPEAASDLSGSLRGRSADNDELFAWVSVVRDFYCGRD